jgi:PKD repeat protein/glucose/arabinose dehydrogenase
VSLAALSLALLAPSAASAASHRARAAAEDYKVLVVTSTQDAVTAAGVAAIEQAGSGAGFTVTAPAPADVGAQFTPENLDGYRAVVFLATGMASPLTDGQRANFEQYFRDGGGFVGIGSAIETDPSWQFLSDILGTRSSGRTAAQSATVKVADRVHDATSDLPEYWERTDAWYNFADNVRGVSHVLASVVEDPFGPQPQGNVLDGIDGGTMGPDHPVSWCKDYRGGRSFYTALGTTAAAYDAGLRTHLAGAIGWAAGFADPVYSDCGATVLANYEQTKISGPPNLDEPIGFDQLPDGRIIQTARTGTVRLHDPETGTTQVIADFSDPSLPTTMRLYTHSEDGLYGPAIDNDFAANKWVYLYYSPQTVTDVKLSDGSVVTQTTPNTTPPNSAPSLSAWDPYVGYFQLSRFKFVDADGSTPAHLDLASEQQILRVPVNRQECCHVAGDIDFDTHGNLWMVTGDDTPAGGINGGGFAPANDQLTDEQQTVRVTGATAGTFTLSFAGQTTAALPYNATRDQIDAALEALPNIGADEIQTSGGPVSSSNVNVFFRRARQQSDQSQITADGAGLTGGGVTTATAQEGGWFQRPTGDSRRGAGNSNDLRGKLLRFRVKAGDIAAADANRADFGAGGAYTIPDGNLFGLVAGAPQAKTRPEIYAMGFRNPFRVQIGSDDVAYVSDYSPDSQVPQRSRGPAGTGRYEIVRHPANYGWPECYSSKLGYYKWNYHEFAPGTTTAGTPLTDPPEPIDCGGAHQINDSRWNLEGGPSVEPGLRELPPVTDPDIWYSYRDNNAANPLGTPCFGNYATTPGEVAPGSTTECPRLFPELYTGGVAPHGSDVYEFDPDNPNPKKFPPYYDGSVIIGEFGQDTMREVKLDAENRVQKINPFLNCGQAPAPGFAFECDNPMDMQFGDDGAFYLLTYGDGFFNMNPDAGMYRWDYVKGKRAPRPVLTTDRTDGTTPLTVEFSSEGTADPDPGDSIVIDWDFGDGTGSTDPNPTHTYTERGRYTAVLKVTDSSGQSAATSTVITVGNTSPSISIALPVEGTTFAFGDTIPYSVSVSDPEDGSSIDCADVQVTFVLGHDTHGHAEETTTGCTGSLPTSADDVSHGGNVFGVINVRYTDKGGPGGVPSLTTIAETKINQRKQQVEHAVNQSGTRAVPNTDEGSGEHLTSLRDGDWVQLNGPFDLMNIDSVTFRVSDNSNGRTPGSPLAAIEVHTGAPDGPVVLTANLTSTGGSGVWASQTFPIALSGLNELFLVFRQVEGGQAGNNLFLLNYAEFNGKGATGGITTSVPGTVGGSVPPTLAISLGANATFGAFTPGVARTYGASTTASVTSSAGDATLSVADPSSTATGHLVNGSYALDAPLLVKAASANGAGGAFAPVGGAGAPTAVLGYGGPVANDAVTVSFEQSIAADEGLRTGSYGKTLTFTLSTTTP